MKKRKTLRLLVTITCPSRVSPLEVHRTVRRKINRIGSFIGEPQDGIIGIRAAKVVPATEAQFEKLPGDR